MKKSLFVLFMLGFTLLTANAQQFSGKWEGKLSLGLNKLPLVFNIMQHNDTQCDVTMDSPAQGATGIPCEESIDNDKIVINIPAINGKFSGSLSEDVINGTFSQNGFDLPLKLKCSNHDNGSAQVIKQEKNNNEREVTFSHDGITLSATLAMPKDAHSPCPAVILVSGSGTQDRDETILGHKPFKTISDFLTQNGVAVLRYDDRGAGKSSALVGTETTLHFAQDALAAFNFLATEQGIDAQRIGYIGHSEGGQIAMINAASDKRVAFIISLAGPAVKGQDLMVKQNLSMLDMAGIPYTQAQVDELKTTFNHIATISDTTKLRETLRTDLSKSTLQHYTPEQLEQAVAIMTSPWYVASIGFNPEPYLKKINCPMLALGGEWDFQVDAHQNLTAIKAIVKNATCVTLPRHNHMFQECNSRTESANYGSLGEISQLTLDTMLQFIKKQ